MYVDNNVGAGFVFCLPLILSPFAKPAPHDPCQLPLMHVGEAAGLWGSRVVLTGAEQGKNNPGDGVWLCVTPQGVKIDPGAL